MARHHFGGGATDWVLQIDGTTGDATPVPTTPILFFTDLTGGTQVTDLLDPLGSPASSILTDANGFLPDFQAADTIPDTRRLAVDANSGLGPRYWIFCSDLSAEIDEIEATIGGIGSGAITAAAAGVANAMVCPVVGDGVTDDSAAITTFLAAVGASAEGAEILVQSPLPGGSVYINATVQIKTSNTTLRFGSPVVYGPLGRIRIYGAYASTPVSGFPHLTAAAHIGDTAVTVTDRSFFAAGSFIEIRGDHDVTGASLWFEYLSVTSVTAGAGSTGTLHLSSALQNDYTVTYVSGSFTEVVAITSSLATSTPTRGDRTVVLADTSHFVAGDYVQVIDDSLTTSSAGAPQPQNYYHREIAQVRKVTDPTHLLLNHALHHTYDTSQNARVTKINAVVKSKIDNVSATWSAMSTVENAFEMKFAVQSAITNSRVAGNGLYSWLNQGFRQGDSLYCYVDNCYADFPVLTGAGQGYGATLYGATACTVRNSKFSSCRHSVLFYYGASGNHVYDCKSDDVRISDYDCHGAEAVDNWIDHCLVVGGDSVPDDSATPIKAACKAGNENHVQGDKYNTWSDIEVVGHVFNGTAGAIQVVPQSSDNTFRNIRVKGCSYGVRLVANSSATTLVSSNTLIDGCHFEDVTNLSNIDGGASSVLSGVTFQHCTFTRATTTLGLNNADKVRVWDCTWVDPAQPATTYAINASGVTHLSVKSNDMSGSYRGVKLATCPSARIFRNVMHDLADTTLYEDAGGNTGAYFAENDYIGFAPFFSFPNPLGVRYSGTGPSSGQVIRTERPYFTDSPRKHGWNEWNFDPSLISQSGAFTFVSGTRYVMKFTAQNNEPISNIIVNVNTAGSGLTSGQNLAAVYDDQGVQLGITGDQTTNWASTGLKVMSVSGAPIAKTAGREYYIEVMSNGTTPATFGRQATADLAAANGGFGSNAQNRFSVNGTAQTALASPLVLSSNTATGAVPMWVATS
jgi:hypothetical protein